MTGRFNFSKSEKVGVAVLSIVIVGLLTMINKPRHGFMSDLLVTDTTAIDYIYPEKKKFKKANTKEKVHSKQKYTEFDPNNYTQNDWRKIGFSNKQALVILNYKKQIGSFKSASDISSCFVISPQKFKEIEPYLIFEKSDIEDRKLQSKQIEIETIELNSADAITLQSVKGIGPFFAKKMIELKLKLGGYSKVSQIQSIYGMNVENYERIKQSLSVDSTLIIPIKLDEATFDQLKRHPYLNWKQSQVLITQVNKIVNEAFWVSLAKNPAFSKNDICRLQPYLK